MNLFSTYKRVLATLTTTAILSIIPLAAHGQVTAGSAHRLTRAFSAISNTSNAARQYISRTKLTKAELAATMSFSISLPLRNLDELRALVSDRQRISISELDNKYFPLPSDYRRVANWLKAQGFRLGKEDPNHLLVNASGPVSLVSTAFQMAVGKVTTPDGQFTSAIEPPLIPASIADVVLSVSGLQPYRHAHECIVPTTNQMTLTSSVGVNPPTYAQHSFYMMTGADIRSLYNAPSNLTGSGQTVAVMVNAPFSSADLSAYNTYTGNPFSGTFNQINVGTPPSGKDDNFYSVQEAALDVQAVASTAPAANIRLYTIPDLSPSSLELGLNQMISDIRQNVPITVISMSLTGAEETVYTTSELQALDQLFLTTTALGVTNVAASGDQGYLSPEGNSQYAQQAGYPASDPYVTGVGGTSFHTDWNQSPAQNVNTTIPSSSYIGETVFSLYSPSTPSGSAELASGGNVSQYFSRPTWQTGNGTFLATQTHRCVPDVAAPFGMIINHSSASDTGSGNATWEGAFSVIFTNIDSQTNASQQIIEPVIGTSLASPVFAGIVALINQSRGSLGSIGFLNPWLYEIGENTQWQAFHDEAGAYSNLFASLPAVGTNGNYTTYSNNNGEFSETAGYDLCTGLGSPNIANLVTALQGNVIVIAPQNQTVTPGSTVVFSAFAEINPYLIAPATYQWYKNGSAITGATNAQLEISGSDTQLSNSGDQYYCIVQLSNSQQSNSTIHSQTATLTVESTTNIGHVTGLSSRALVGTGSNDLVGGLIIGGQGSMPIMMRAIGPTLTAEGFTGSVLQDPKLTVYNSTPSVIASNYIWGGSSVLSNAFAALGLYPLATNSTDSAIFFANNQSTPALAAGLYTGQVDGNSGDTGNALLEFYDANAAEGVTWTQGMPYLSAISARAYVGSSSNILVGGFIISGSTSRTMLIRATGPTLTTLGVPNALADPKIILFDSNGTPFASNEVWNGNPLIASAAASVGEYPWSTGSNDSAILVTLKPGIYTAEIEGATGDSGVALLEIYLLN